MKRSLSILAVVVAAAAGGAAWYIHGKLPQRSGEIALEHLQAPVSVAFDGRGVPHIQAGNQLDMYRTLGYLHAQDRLFQMEMARRLSRGELAEILGPNLLRTDKMFRSLRIRDRAARYVAEADKSSPQWQALQAYLDGINQYQDKHAKPLEFDVLGIPKHQFTAEDTLSVAGYMAYSFASALRSEPLMTFVRDKLGGDYLKIFDYAWHPEGVVQHGPQLADADWKGLGEVARLSHQALVDAGLPQLEGSNAWAVSGSRTASGKPILAGDPHIGFGVPAVWYEAHLKAPDFELYGYQQALIPFALIGNNRDFGWSLTMFQNDDMDLIAEKVNPDNPNQVMYHGQWVDLEQQTEQIKVKGEAPVDYVVRRSPHGPIINDVLRSPGQTPIAMWWAFLETDNPILRGFYRVNRADTLEKMRTAAADIQAPGLNLVWANAKGDIGFWAAAQIPIRPKGVDPTFILDGSTPDADKLGYYPFSDNPQEENPSRGYIVSANYQPVSPNGITIPGYYNLPDRGQQLDTQVQDPAVKWDVAKTQALQLGTRTGYGVRTLAPLLPILRQVATDERGKQLVALLADWSGDYPLNSVAATVFHQLSYEIAQGAMSDELGPDLFHALLSQREFDKALPRLMASEDSPWWDDRSTPAKESRTDIVTAAWQRTLAHLSEVLGSDPKGWEWGKAHTLTHNHPLGMQKPLDRIFNVGPFSVPGSHEVPNNLSASVGSAPWAVDYGPSTRRVMDFSDPNLSVTINPVGQSGVLFDKHYSDQAQDYANGVYRPVLLEQQKVQEGTVSSLTFKPEGR